MKLKLRTLGPHILTLLLLMFTFAVNTSQSQTNAGAAQAYVEQLRAEVQQATIQKADKNATMLEYRAKGDTANARRLEQEIKTIGNNLIIKNMQVAMWQQQVAYLTKSRPPLSADPQIAQLETQIIALEDEIQQISFQRAQLAINQTVAMQRGDSKTAATYGQQLAAVQKQTPVLTAKMQAIQARIQALKQK